MEMNNPEYLLKNSGPWTKDGGKSALMGGRSKKKMLILFLLFMLFNNLAISKNAEDPSIIIEKMFSSLGGELNIEKLETCNYILKKVQLRKLSLEPKQRIEVLEYFKAPNKVRVETDFYFSDPYEKYTKRFIFFDGETKWTNLGRDPEKITETKKEKVKPSLNRWSWLLKLKKENPKLLILNEEKRKERTLYKIKLISGKNYWIILFIDRNSYFPVKTIDYKKSYRIGGISYDVTSEVVHDNFEKINGVFIPFKTKSKSKFRGEGVHKDLIEEIEEVISELKIGNHIKLDDDFFNLEKSGTPRTILKNKSVN